MSIKSDIQNMLQVIHEEAACHDGNAYCVIGTDDLLEAIRKLEKYVEANL